MATIDTSTLGGENFYVSSTKEREDAEATEKSENKDRVNHDDFLKLLVAQLTHQDPMEPMDDSQFMGQMAQLQALDEQIEMTAAVNGMRLDSQLRTGNEVIGKQVTGYTEDGDQISGVAKTVIVRDDEVYVQLENLQRIRMDKISDIQEPLAAAS